MRLQGNRCRRRKPRTAQERTHLANGEIRREVYRRDFRATAVADANPALPRSAEEMTRRLR